MKKILLIFLVGGLMTSSVYSKDGHIWKGRAVLVIKKEKLGEFKKAVSKIVEPTRKEKGCISYEGYQVVGVDGNKTNKFEFHELWVSKEAMLIDHKENSPHMKAFFKEIKADTPESFLECQTTITFTHRRQL